MSLLADLGEGVELSLNVIATSGMELATPQKGGPQFQEGSAVFLTVVSAEGFVLFAGDSDGFVDINEVFRIHGRDGPTVDITGTVPLRNEEGLVEDLMLDLTLRASGPLVRDEVAHDHFVAPGEIGIHSTITGSHAPATATGTFALRGETYELSTLDIELFDAEISTQTTGAVIVQPASSDWIL